MLEGRNAYDGSGKEVPVNVSRAHLILRGPGAKGVRVSARLLRATVDVLVDAVEEAVRLRVEGRSRARGSKPAWLERAAGFEVELTQGSTVLELEAPPLAEVCPAVFAQGELFEPVAADRSSIDVFADSLADVIGRERDSDLYDEGFLDTVLDLGKVFDQGIESVEFEGSRVVAVRGEDLPGVRDLRRSIPPDQRVRLAGMLDSLRHSNRTFEIVLAGGESVRGVLAAESGEIAEVGPQLGSMVTVEGTAKFRASGRLLRLDADWISATSGDAALWSAPPRPLFAPLGPADLRLPQGPRSGVAAIFGQWPGDESEEEVQALLRELS